MMMKAKSLLTPLSALLAAPLFAGSVVFSDDFKDPAAFAKNWDFRAPTAPADGVLAVEKNHFNPALKLSLEGKDALVVSAEFALADGKGFGGFDFDGIKFVIRGENAVAIFKSPLKSYMDSRLRKIEGVAPETFIRLEVVRTKDGDDWKYVFSAGGTEVCTLEKQKIPVTNKLILVKSQTDMKVRNLSVSEGSANE